MRLFSIRIKSYRSVQNTKLDLPENLISLIGINGAGKSNILNAITMFGKLGARYGDYYREQGQQGNLCQIEAVLSKDDIKIGMKADITFDTDEHNSDEIKHVVLKWQIKTPDETSRWVEIPIECFHYYDHLHSDQLIITSSTRQIRMNRYYYENYYKKMPKALEPHIQEVLKILTGTNYYSASQFSDPTRCPVSFELEDNRLVKRFRSRASHDQFIFDLYRASKDNVKGYNKFLSTVNDEGVGLIDGVMFNEIDIPFSSYEVQSGGKIKKIEKNKTLIVPSFKIDDSILSPNQLSEGTFKTLALLFYLITDQSRLLIIEEPEVCIHHGLLNSVIAIIKSQSNKKQILISTHSDYVIDHLKPENIVMVTKNSTRGTEAKSLSKTLSKNDFKALHKYLNDSGNLGEYWKDGGFNA